MIWRALLVSTLFSLACGGADAGVFRTAAEGPWLRLEYAKGVPPIGSDEGWVVEGAFSGKTDKEVFHEKAPDPSMRTELTLYVLRVEKKVKKTTGDDEVDAAVLSGP